MEQGFRSARHIAADRRMPDASVTGDRESSNGLRILGPGSPPHLGFACCEYGVEQMQSLFAQPDLIETLKDLHATVAIPTQDFSPSGLESCAFSIEKAHRYCLGCSVQRADARRNFTITAIGLWPKWA
jgi:hypothetical protein